MDYEERTGCLLSIVAVFALVLMMCITKELLAP